MVDQILIPLKPLINEKKASFNKNISQTIKSFRADISHLSVVFSNIIENALVHINPKGIIHFSATKEKQQIQFCISDDGSGIAEDKIPFIFDKFVQVESTLSRQKGTGTGLGLAICKYIIEAHGGKIQCESKEGE